MKNLIITTGILLLMIMGILYDQDCTEVIRMERRLAWTCEEMAAGAAAVLQEKGGTETEAKSVAAEILRRNLHLDENMNPESERGVLQETVEWTVVFTEDAAWVQVDCGEGRVRLSILKGLVRLKHSENFLMKRS